jgi:tetratricopeptide (TPR) repeat protein
MKKLVLPLLLLLLSFPVLPQKGDPLFQKATLFYQNDEYEMALAAFNDLIKKYPDNTDILTSLAECYLHTGQVNPAIAAFAKALKKSPDLPKAVYGLGNAYDISGDTDSAVFWFRKYRDVMPEDPSGYIRLSVLFMTSPGLADSSVLYAKKAVELEPSSQKAGYTLAMAYIQEGKYNQAINTAVKSLSFDSTSSMLYYPWGISLFFQHNYGLAYQVFTKGSRFETTGTDLTRYRAISLIMSNTPSDVYTFNEAGQPVFQVINERNLDALYKRLHDRLDKYYYPALEQKFIRDPLSMGLDEYFMYYLGFSGTDDYLPYSLQTDSLDQYLAAAKYPEYIRHARDILARDPTEYAIYKTLSMVYGLTGDSVNEFKALVRYTGFNNAVLASGNGSGPGYAYIVTNVNHEYEVLKNFGYLPAGQTAEEKHNHHYDIITAKTPGDSEEDLWFNTDIPYGSMESLMKKRRNEKR